MAHDLQGVLDFFAKFGDDVYTCFDGTKHKMSDYANAVKKFVVQEVAVVKKAVDEVKAVVDVLKVDLKAAPPEAPKEAPK